jgi:hypothetical protein
MLLRSKLLALAISAAFLVLPAGVSAESGFLDDVDDLPLAPGLVEDPAARVVFDKPAGRIVEAAASGAVSAGAVTRFYAQTLPGLGWTARAGDAWVRGDEVLRLQVEQAGPPVIVRFSIAPKK